MYCPKCKSEYIEGYTHCKKCDVDLVDELPEEPHEHKAKDNYLPSIDPVAVKYVSNAVDAEMMMEILRNEGIPCFRKSREAGGYLSISMGFSIFGEDIYVDKENAQAALDILDGWDVVCETSVEETDSPNEPNEHYDNTPSYKRHRLAARIFAFSSVALTIFVLLYWTVTTIQSLLHN